MKPQESGVKKQEAGVRKQESVVRGHETPTPDSCPLTPELDDPQVIRAVQQYLAAMEAGCRPNRQEFLARYQDIAEALAECLDALEFVRAVGPRLDEPDVGNTADPRTSAAPVGPSTPLGDFRILLEIGRGGMGIVYEAEQLSLCRRIALKVLPFASTFDQRHLQRFKNEAQAAAHLHHPHIVPVYAVGCERGVHYYAMQYIDGQSLAALIQELRQQVGLAGPGSAQGEGGARARVREVAPPRSAPGKPRPTNGEQTGPYRPAPHAPESPAVETTSRFAASLATECSTKSPAFFRAAANLAVQAAEALEHAHEQGVVHRDIKPGNLLIDVRGHLWVTDFGLAKVHSGAALTITGDVLGTLRYASPEQALAKRGLVDYRTDLYSLGATVYELLTLEPPFDGRDREELLRQIAFEEPCPPRRLNPAIPTDLETIVLKALAKAPEERYATAQELANDLRRFLEDKPILACRPTLLEKATKWSRRHKPVVVSAVVLLVIVALGLAVSTVRIAREQARTQAAYDAEAEQRARAETSFRAARQAVDFFTQVAEEELADRPEMQGVRRKLLEAALEYYQDFIDQRGDDAALRAELVESHLRVAAILNEIGKKAEALAAMEQARQIQESLVRAHPTVPEYRRGLSSIHRNLDRLQGGDRLWLLLQKPVQLDLKLSEDQVGKAKQLWDRRRESWRGHRDLGQEERHKQFEARAAQERALADFLRPEQARRLKQIAWQQRGTGALSDPEVAQALGLTDEQKVTIRAIHDEVHRAPWGGHRGEGSQKAEDRSSNTREQLMNVLTADQQAQWKEMTGKPFQGKIRPPHPGSFGPRPGHWNLKRP